MSEFTDQLRRNGEGNRALVVAAALEIERLTADGTVLRELITQFDAAIRRIATELTGQACGGVDTGDNINPETGEPYGPGGHTGWLLAKEAKKLRDGNEQLHARLTCMCGSWVDQHGLGDGHSPVSMYDHALDKVTEERDEKDKELARLRFRVKRGVWPPAGLPESEWEKHVQEWPKAQEALQKAIEEIAARLLAMGTGLTPVPSDLKNVPYVAMQKIAEWIKTHEI